jgi:hypothetical protein
MSEELCPLREGQKDCPWWVTGCLQPNVAPAIKLACGKASTRLPRLMVKK